MSNIPKVIENLFYFNKKDSENILQVLGKYMFKREPVPCSILPVSVPVTPPQPFYFLAPSISSLPSHCDDIGYIATIDEEQEQEQVQEQEQEQEQEQNGEQKQNGEQEQQVETMLPEAPVITTAPEQIEYLSPKHQDTLFWCIYIAVFGYNDYLQVSRNYGVKELEVKQTVGNWIQKNQGKMKEANIKITKVAIQEILSELLTSVKETSIMSMVGMIVYFKINIILVDSTGALMLEFKANKDNDSYPTYVLQKDSYGKYKLRSDSLDVMQVNEFKKTMVCLESYLKPLKPLSTYHIDDLKNIARRLGGFDENYKYKKPELYEELNEAMKWK